MKAKGKRKARESEHHKQMIYFLKDNKMKNQRKQVLGRGKAKTIVALMLCYCMCLFCILKRKQNNTLLPLPAIKI